MEFRRKSKRLTLCLVLILTLLLCALQRDKAISFLERRYIRNIFDEQDDWFTSSSTNQQLPYRHHNPSLGGKDASCDCGDALHHKTSLSSSSRSSSSGGRPAGGNDTVSASTAGNLLHRRGLSKGLHDLHGGPAAGKDEQVSREDEPARREAELASREAQQASREAAGGSPFRRRFLLWDQANASLASSIGPDHHVSGPDKKYFIYRCDDGGGMGPCGSWADRVKGMMLAYLVANLTGRVFKLEMLSPRCNILDFLCPNRVNWSLPISFHSSLHKNSQRQDVQMISNVDVNDFNIIINQSNSSASLFERHATYVYFKSNLDFSAGLQGSRLNSHDQLSWMSGLSSSQILAGLYQRLFKLSPRLQTRMNEFMKAALPTPRHRLVCAHIRLGTKPKKSMMLTDSGLRYAKAYLPYVWRFLSKRSRRPADRVFFMSDSDYAVRAAKTQPFGDKLIDTAAGPIVDDVDRYENVPLRRACDAMEKVIFYQHVLMQCNVLLTSNSDLSFMAAFVRASQKGLFCFLRGRIVPCQPNTLEKVYRAVV